MDNNVRFTFSQIRYIVCLYRLSQNGHGVKNVEIARALSFSKPSIHNMLRALAELDVVRQEAFGLAFFTEKGRTLAQKYAACYEELEARISDLCGIGAASENALCGLLADMSEDCLNRLYARAIGKNI